MKIKFIFFYLFSLVNYILTLNIQFTNPLQRFLYDELTNTIILASVNHIYSLNATDLSILSDVNLTPEENDNHCLLTNKSSLITPNYYFPISSYLTPSINSTFNQLLLLINNSILICSTSNRGGSCQLRSIENLHLLKNSSQRLVSSSPYYPSIGFINKNKQILYLANTYDARCDPFYEIPTISGRTLSDQEFLSIINFNSGQSALQQSTYTLRLSNIRLIKDFFLYYLYGFEHENISYFLTIQQADISYPRTNRLQTKILRFCQSLKQSIIKSYVEIPLTCGQNYHYLVTAKFSKEKQIFYGIFRNTTLANSSNTSHAICSYSIESIREAFFQAIKRCLVDGKGNRGLGYLSPDTNCIANKNLNEINHDYCPDDDDSFFQYPIGDHRSLEQIEPIIEFNENVNFTALDILSIENDEIIFVGDDHGTVYTFQTSNKNQLSKENLSSSIIIDLQLIQTKSLLRNANLLVLTNNQIIKQNLSTCEQYESCEQCSTMNLCHWCSQEKRCTPTFECRNEKLNEIHMCTNIEQVSPRIISLHSTNTKLEISFNKALDHLVDDYQCQFHWNKQMFHTQAVLLNDRTFKCFPPIFNYYNQSIFNLTLSILHLKSNLTFGYSSLTLINCSNFETCISCTSYSSQCIWNSQLVQCLSIENRKTFVNQRKRLIQNVEQCPNIYFQPTINRLALNMNHTLTIQIEQCQDNLTVNSCQLTDYRKRFVYYSSKSIVYPSKTMNQLCSIKCSFELMNFPQISFHRPLNLDLSIEFSNQTIVTLARTHLSLYDCSHLASNCSSCLQLDSSYGCIWCNNMCLLKNQTEQYTCLNNRECLIPIIDSIEPLILPIHGGSLVTIKGKHFDLFNLTILLANIPCYLIEEESSNTKILCQTSDAIMSRTGPVHLKFGLYGPELTSKEMITYLNPIIHSIEPLIGIESGGTLLTIYGENLTVGNNHISIVIGNRPCQLLSISRMKIQCETSSFNSLILNEQQSIQFYFDRQTKLTSSQVFTVVSNPILNSFNSNRIYQSFMSGGHQLIINGDHFHSIQNIRLEFKRLIFVSPYFHNRTQLIFFTPSIQELNVLHEKHLPQEIEIILHLDHFNQTSSVRYENDPIIYELEPSIQTYTNQLIIYGVNLTNIGHRKTDISVHIGCDLCFILDLQSNAIVCQPPISRPKKYSSTNRVCYDSEHPWIIVTIDNIHSHVGYMIYPRKLIILGIISGCLLTILTVVLIILIIVCLRIRCSQLKSRRRYLYNSSLTNVDTDKDSYQTKIYQKIQTQDFFTTVPIRSYLNYLQICYYSYLGNSIVSSSYDFPKTDMIEQFKYLIDNNDEFLQCFSRILIENSNKTLLINLLFTQRYHLKKFLHLNNDYISFNICILTAYDGFLQSDLLALLFQFYFQLKSKIYSGPIDAIEQTCSYYSLNNQTILHDQSISFNSIQLIIHIDFNQKKNSEDIFILHLHCLTCDTISQIKEKILQKFFLYKKFDYKISITQCQLYLLTNIKSNVNSCSTSSCSSSTTSSSNVPLAKKSPLTQFFSHRSNKYSTTTTTISDSYKDSICLVLNDIDHTNEQMNHAKKLNTLQHYGIINDGYELKMILPKQVNYINQTVNLSSCSSKRTPVDCHQCSNDQEQIFVYLSSLPPSIYSNDILFTEHDRTRYFHLLNHTYEEIGECGHLLMDNNQSETYRLFETKSHIHSLLINLIERLFTNFLHNDIYLSELIEQYSTEYLHIFYGHFIPFLIQNLHCLFEFHLEKALKSSLDILANIFQIACSSTRNQTSCLLCLDLMKTNQTNFNQNIQNCTLLFADEIQRVRIYYSNLEKRLNNKNSSSEYSSTNTGINKTFELDNSIFNSLIEYVCTHIDEFTEVLKTQSSDNKSLIRFYNFIQMYRSSGRN